MHNLKAVVDRTGKLLATDTIYPHVPRNDWDGSLRTLAAICKQHAVEVVSIGNGTGSRETDKLAALSEGAAPVGSCHAVDFVRPVGEAHEDRTACAAPL